MLSMRLDWPKVAVMAGNTQIMAPLRRDARNPRYFHEEDGRAVLLVGAHTWNNLVDMGPRGAVVPFDWDAYLDFLEAQGHNLIRLWGWQSLATSFAGDEVRDFPWRRSGGGVAWDGGPRFDLEDLDDAYFARLAERVGRAGRRGIHVMVQCFEAYASFAENLPPLAAHCFAGANNVNGVDVAGAVTHGTTPWTRLSDPTVLRLQELYVRRLVETVNPFGNVLWEISNEAGPQSHDWQDHMARHIRAIEAGLPHRHPVGQSGGMYSRNDRLAAGPTDWISPDVGGAEGYRCGQYAHGEGPGDPGDRPVILDSDHLWGIGGSASWVWKSVCGGYNVLYMDPWTDKPSFFFRHPAWPDGSDVGVRKALGEARRLAERLDLAAARPLRDHCSTGWCLGVPGGALLAFQPAPEPLSLRLPAGRWWLTWHDVARAETLPRRGMLLPRDGDAELKPPVAGPCALLAEPATPEQAGDFAPKPW